MALRRRYAETRSRGCARLRECYSSHRAVETMTALTRLVEMGFEKNAAAAALAAAEDDEVGAIELLTPDAGAPAPRKRKRLVKQRDAPADDDDDELDERAFERKPSRPRKAPAAAEPEIVITGVETWAQCELCSQWRRLAAPPPENATWTCKQNPDAKYAKCSEPQELPDDEIDRRWSFSRSFAETKAMLPPSTEPAAAAKSHDGRTTPPPPPPTKAAKAEPRRRRRLQDWQGRKAPAPAPAPAPAAAAAAAGDDGSDAEEGRASRRRSCRPAAAAAVRSRNGTPLTSSEASGVDEQQQSGGGGGGGAGEVRSGAGALREWSSADGRRRARGGGSSRAGCPRMGRGRCTRRGCCRRRRRRRCAAGAAADDPRLRASAGDPRVQPAQPASAAPAAASAAAPQQTFLARRSPRASSLD